MNTFKFFSLLLILSLIPLTNYAQTMRDTLVPQTTISVEQARTNRDRFLSNHKGIDHSAFTYDYAELKKFVDFLESQKAKGVDVEYVTVYLSEYENGQKSAFLAPLKKDGTPNYNVKALNHGSVIPPRKPTNGRSVNGTHDEVRY